MDCFVASLLAMTLMNRRYTFGVLARSGARTSIPEISVIEPNSRSVPDAPLSRGMTEDR
jgi:hypothetical protein